MGKKPSTYRPIVIRKLVSLIKSHGFYNDKGTKHGKYARDGDEHKIMIPRGRKTSSGLSQQLCSELIKIHKIPEDDVMRLF